MKKFDIELAKAGKPVQTRDGRKVEILKYDLNNTSYPIVVVLSSYKGSYDIIEQFTLNGNYYTSSAESSLDLFMVPTKTKYFVYVYRESSMKTLFSVVQSKDTWEQTKAFIMNDVELVKTLEFEIED